jgi:KaiC/GvpD/RAD55 family RecA-like ATPase
VTQDTKIQPDFTEQDDALFDNDDDTNEFASKLRNHVGGFENPASHEDHGDDRGETITGMFRVRSARDVLTQAALQDDPIELYSPLIVENELIIVFADTGIGKTVFGVQMGISMAAKQVVLYVDLELSDKQFEKRYKDQQGQHYQFPPNFFRADFTPRFQPPKGLSYEEYFIQSLEQAIEATSARVVIIDNMTKIAAGDTDTAKATIPVMENLNRLKFDSGITFVVLEHNKKVDSTRPISLNDLQGSKMKSNFADAVFSIGRSQTDKNLRYIKQLKVRSAELIYDTENVATYEITSEGGFLHFEPIGFGSEYEFLKLPADNEKTDKLKQLYEQIQAARDKGLKGDALATHLQMSKGHISKIEAKYNARMQDKTEVS